MGLIQKYERTKLSSLIWFLAGFLGGVIIPNVIWKTQWNQKIVSIMYLLYAFTGRASGDKDYLLQLIVHRMVYFVIIALGGVTVFGVILARSVLWCIGMEIGSFLTISVLHFGFQGGFVGVGFLLPHQLVYVPVWFLFAQFVNDISMNIWKNHGLYPVRLKRYFKSVFLSMGIYFGGILLEFYINPIITEMLTKSLKIF